MLNLKSVVLAGSVITMLAVTGCQMFERDTSDRTAGRVLDDKTITSNVEKKLSTEPVYKFNDVDVKTFAGVVQLSGFVSSEEQKQRAGQLAENVEGVARVVNNITLKSAANLSPTGRTDAPYQSAPLRGSDRDASRTVDPNGIDRR